jgi:hypothetical protein
MLACENAGCTRAKDVLAYRPPKILLVDAFLTLPQASILNGFYALAVDGPDLARQPNLIDPVHVCIVERVKDPPNTRSRSRKGVSGCRWQMSLGWHSERQTAQRAGFGSAQEGAAQAHWHLRLHREQASQWVWRWR